MIKNTLVAIKEKMPSHRNMEWCTGTGVIVKCGEVRNILVNQWEHFERDLKKTLKPPCPIYDHSNITGHHISIDNFSIVGREAQNLTRTIKEAIFIRVSELSLNRNIGKYQLPPKWDDFLFDTPEHKLK